VPDIRQGQCPARRDLGCGAFRQRDYGNTECPWRRNAYSDTHTSSLTNPNRDRHSDCNCDGDGNCNCHADSDGYHDCNSNAYGYSNTHGYSELHA